MITALVGIIFPREEAIYCKVPLTISGIVIGTNKIVRAKEIVHLKLIV
jgi:hypothetical protein